MGAGARAWPDAIMPTLVAHCPGMQCTMVGACCYSTCHAVPALVAEVERLRAVEEVHAMLLRTVRGLPRPRPYYGSAIWQLDQALGLADESDSQVTTTS